MMHVLITSIVACADGAVRMPRWFSDNLVLQTSDQYGARCFLNGVANPGETVEISGGTGSYTTFAESDGAWAVQLDPAYKFHRQPMTITVQGEDGPPVVASGVTAGDVFFCGGQGDMVFPMKLALDSDEEIATLADFPKVRFFMTGRDTAAEPQFDLAEEPEACDGLVCNQWVEGNASYLAEFSALCYMTARDITRMHLGGRPVGLVQAAWDDTRLEAWMSADSIAGTSVATHVPSRAKRNAAGALYNAMIAPWNRMAVRAAFWHQGGANADEQIPGVDQTAYYAELYQAMIRDWRDKKGMGDFAWLTMQLPPSVAAGTEPLKQMGTGRMQIRLAQAESDTHANGLTDISGVAIGLDLGGSSALGIKHPPNKNEMARRLALQAVHVAYAIQDKQSALTAGARGCVQRSTQYDSRSQGNINLENASHSMASGEACQRLCSDTSGCSCFSHNSANGSCWLMSQCSTPITKSGYIAGAAANKPCPGPVGTTVWTGPQLSGIEAEDGKVVLHFTALSSAGMQLEGVKAFNSDGTSNGCTLCCEGAPPFEVADGQSGYKSVGLADVLIKNSSIELALPLGQHVTGVRYAWLDYAECVLRNSDGLPAGPFEEIVRATHQLPPTPPPAPPPAPTPVPVPASARRPPMGWNSWNFYHCNIDENIVKGVLDAMVSNGMKDAGYEYVNVDDCWAVERFPDGTIQPDPARFPSGIKAVADYAHGQGLKFGVYTARGSRTCQHRPGSYAHEEIDAATYCEWGLDYLKNDNCGGDNWPVENTSWVKFAKGFDDCYHKTGRYTVRSIEFCKDPDSCGQWIASLANLWRTTEDIQATWGSAMANIHENDKMAAVARPGHFNDPDMMNIGVVGLSLIEQYSHMSLWCVAGAPLLVGTDIVHASAETLRILTNKEVIAINQDLGYEGAIQGRIVASTSQSEVWSKRLEDGESFGVALLNLDSVAMNISARWADLGSNLTGPAAVRDLWKHKDLGVCEEAFTAEVPSHGVVFVRITRQAVLVV